MRSHAFLSWAQSLQSRMMCLAVSSPPHIGSLQFALSVTWSERYISGMIPWEELCEVIAWLWLLLYALLTFMSKIIVFVQAAFCVYVLANFSCQYPSSISFLFSPHQSSISLKLGDPRFARCHTLLLCHCVFDPTQDGEYQGSLIQNDHSMLYPISRS